MPEPTSARSRLDPVTRRWGLGEVVFGLLAAQALAVFAAVVVMSAAGWTQSSDIPIWGQAVLQIPLWGGYVGAVVLAGRKGQGVVSDFGLRIRRWDLPVGAPIGVVVQILVLPLLYWPILRLLDETTSELSAPARALSEKAQSPWGWVVLSLIVVVGAPVVEELFFRGLLLRSLQKRGMSDVWACVACAAVFAAIHLQPLQFVGLFVIGFVLSVLAVRTGRLGPSICTHAGFNAASVVLLYLSR